VCGRSQGGGGLAQFRGDPVCDVGLWTIDFLPALALDLITVLRHPAAVPLAGLAVVLDMAAHLDWLRVGDADEVAEPGR